MSIEDRINELMAMNKNELARMIAEDEAREEQIHAPEFVPLITDPHGIDAAAEAMFHIKTDGEMILPPVPAQQ